MEQDEAALRAALVDQIMTWQSLSDSVAEAMRTVPRHVFVPQVSMEEAYTDDSVVTRRDAEGVATSSASSPWLVGLMADQLQVSPGMKVLEIGGGTGYNAALMSHLVGPDGHVTSVEITPDVADDARQALASAGISNVEVICADGEFGHAPNAPYDRIIVTAGAWEIPTAWADQLASDGILVVPLRMKGLTRSVAFTRDGDVWRSSSAYNCGFMPVSGAGEMAERNIRLGEDLTIRIDDGWDVDAAALKAAAAGSGAIAWTGIVIDSPLDLLDFYLADMDGFCRVLAKSSITDRGMAEPLNGWGSMGVATAEALAYLTKRASTVNKNLFELGACAYGPAAQTVLEELTGRIDRWMTARDTTSGIRVDVCPAGKGETADALMVVDKRHSRVVVRPETKAGA